MNGAFRVWCKNKKEWETHMVLMDGEGNLLHDAGGAFTNLRPLNRETHIVEFYTGLKDKNGKRIFEGDDVVSDYGLQGVMTLEKVFYNKVECTISENIEIIGNIHDKEAE